MVRQSARCRALPASALLLAWLAAGGPAPGEEDRPAVELYNPTPRFPAQAAAVEVVPEVTIEVEVDELGKVDAARVVEVRPSTELDFLFEEAVVSAVSTWRYAPRIEDGVPVRTVLRWTQSLFVSDADRSRRMSDTEWWDAVLGREPTQGHRFLTMPLADRRKLLEEQVRLGLEMLDGSKLTRAVGESFVVHTDAGKETDRVVLQNLEAAYSLLWSLIGEGIALEPEELKLQVLVFFDEAAFHRFRARSFPSETLFSGFYSSLGLVAFHLYQPSPDDVLALLLHETTHAFVDRHLVRAGVRLPVWLQEGLAEYIANSKIEKGRLLPGEIRRAPIRRYAMEQGAVVVRDGRVSAAATVADIRRAARQGRALTLAQMLDADRETFYGEDLSLYYGAAGLLVHFLRHGRPGWADEAFPRFLLYVAEGFPPSAALEAAYGTTAVELEEPYRLHLAAI
jgi:TonB family protein